MKIDCAIVSKRAISRFNRLEEDFNNVHKFKYDYSDSIYRGASEKIEILCNKHGKFKQTVSNHLKGKGCPKCGINSRVTKIRKNKMYYIKKAKEIHGDIYDYSKVPEGIKSREIFKLGCKEHGYVDITFNKHIDSKKGCPKCGRNKSDISKRLTTKEWILRAINVHGDRYDYSKSKYIKQKENITISCKEHGDFEQLPYNHLNGSGCPICSSVGAFDLDSEATLYVIKFNNNNIFKVGITNDLKSRLYHYKDFSLVLNYKFKTGKEAKTMESKILFELSEFKYEGKRFIERGFTELLRDVNIVDIDNLIKGIK